MSTPNYHYTINLTDKLHGNFQEITGLEPQFPMPKTPKLTLKKSVFTADDAFWEWQGEIQMNTIAKRTMTIQLKDESGNTSMSWVLKNAWPTKVTTAPLKVETGQAEVESVEIAYEQLTIGR